MRRGSKDPPECFSLICLVALVALPSAVLAEDETDPTDLLDAAVVTTFTFICAAMLSFFGLLLAYSAFVEDALLRRYKQEGEVVTAAVVASNFTRIAGPSQRPSSASCGSTSPENEEYVALIDYRYPGSPSYDAYIRKLVKVFACDLMEAETGKKSPLSPSQTVSRGLQPAKEDGEPDANVRVSVALPLDFSPISWRSFDSVPFRHEVQILVMPGYRLSGFPLRQAERMIRFQYRLPTLMIVLSSWTVSTFGFWVCVNMYSHDDDMSHAAEALFLQLAVLVFEGLGIAACFGHTVEEEYFQTGSLLEDEEYDAIEENSTISTNDGSYL